MNVARLQADVEQGKRHVQSFVHDAERTFKTLRNAFGAYEIVEGIKHIIDAGKEWEGAQNRLIGIMRATQGAAGISLQEITSMAEERSKASLADENAVKNVASTLLRFGVIQGDVFREGVKLSLDLAGAMGNDFAGASQKLGQALASPATGLKGLQEVIGKLNPTQLQTINHFMQMGQLASAQAEILKIVRERVGGLQDQLNTGLSRATGEATKAMNNFLETFAKMPEFEKPVVAFFDALTHGLEKLKGIAEHGDWLDKIAGLGNMMTQSKGLADIASTANPGKLFGISPDVMDMVLGRKPRTTPPAFDAISAEDAGMGDAMREHRALTKAEEERQRLLLEHAQKMAGSNLAAVQAWGQQVVEAERAVGQRRMELMDLYHARGLVSIKDYYAAARDAAEVGTMAELAAVERNIEGFWDPEKGKKTGGLWDALALVPSDAPERRKQVETELVAAMNKREEAYRRLAQIGPVTDLKQANAAEEFRDAIRAINVELLKEQGLLTSAAGVDFDLKNKLQIRQLLSNASSGDPALSAAGDEGLRIMAERKSTDIGKANFQELVNQASTAQTLLAANEMSIQALERSGAITSLESMARVGQARKAAIADLESIAEAMRTVAATVKGPAGAALQASAEEAGARIKDLVANVDQLGLKVRATFEDNITGILDGLADRAQRPIDVIKNGIRGITRELLHLSNQAFARQIFNAAGGSSIGASILAMLGLGGGGYSKAQGTMQEFQLSSTPSEPDIPSFVSDALIGGRATGGPVTAGTPYWVGERGVPELFVPDRSGTIIPESAVTPQNAMSWMPPEIGRDVGAGGASGGGDTHIHIHIQNNINAAGAYPESIQDIRRALADVSDSIPDRAKSAVQNAVKRREIRLS